MINGRLRSFDARLATLLIAALTVVAFIPLAWTARVVVDDAFINFRIVENILAGNGPVYNPDERVEAGTSVLWVVGLALLHSVLRRWHVDLPYLSVVCGIVCGAAGLATSQIAAWRIQSDFRPARRGVAAVMLPVGTVLVLALPPFREFVASGLETGLVLFWIGLAMVALTDPLRFSGNRLLAARAALIGLGPLLRPDLAIMTAVFLTVMMMGERKRWPRVAGIAAAGVAAPAAVQLWRMGYYACLVPNTALAKEAFSTRWDQGWIYLSDFVAPYLLVVPILTVTGWLCFIVIRSRSAPARRLTLAAMAAGCLHALYVIRFGGDFMHARLLLPSLFVFIAPVALWGVRPAIEPRPGPPRLFVVSNALLMVGLFSWALLCGTSLRVPYHGSVDASSGIADESTFYRNLAGRPNPVTPDDYIDIAYLDSVRRGTALRTEAARGRRVLRLGTTARPPGEWPAQTLVVDEGVIGLFGYVAGLDVHIVDQFGLADPMASRLAIVDRGRPGHEKWLPTEWLVARFGTSDAVAHEALINLAVGDARAALSCSPLADLHAAVTSPLSPSRFVSNVSLSFRLTFFRFVREPAFARRELCGEA